MTVSLNRWHFRRKNAAGLLCGPAERNCLVPVIGLFVTPGAARSAVSLLYVLQTPLDLRGRVGLPVGAHTGHPGTRQRLRDAIRTAGVLRVNHPAAFVCPQVVEAAELRRRKAETGKHVIGN